MRNGSRLDWAEARARVDRVGDELARGGTRSGADRDRVLRDRAARLARPAKPLVDDPRGEMLIVVRLGAERFAFPISGAVEVIRDPRCSPVPLAPPALAGVLQVRGEIRPVFHLSRAVNLPDPDASSRVVLLLRRGGREAGLLVDGVEDTRPVPVDGRRPAPAGMPHILWLTPDLVPVLDPDHIFPEEMA